MLIPTYWAERRGTYRRRKRDVVVTRFGWSIGSQAEADAMAEERLREALARFQAARTAEAVASGIRARLVRREPRVPYNGAEGVPIREEVVQRIDPDVVTRNSYGALCLNTPDVLFVDVDAVKRKRSSGRGRGSAASRSPVGTLLSWLPIVSFVVLIALGHITEENMTAVAVAYAAGIVIFAGLRSRWRTRARERAQRAASSPQPALPPPTPHIPADLPGDDPQLARLRDRLDGLLAESPEWHFRIYRTPAGFRVLVMHRVFDPGAADTARCFQALDADADYVRLCLTQRCFRARVTPKPWRIGLREHLSRRLAWPVSPEQKPVRDAWVAAYEQAAQGYAACAFVEERGSAATVDRTRAVQQLHDTLSGATSGRPIA